MDALQVAMRYYPYVFHPAVCIGVATLLLIHYEWRRQDADRSSLRHRIGTFLAAGLLSLAPTGAYAVVTGSGVMKIMQGNAWQVDALVASGIAVAAAATWVAWRRFDWGPLVPGSMVALVAATIPYIALSPVWNYSGHVTMALMPTLYLTLVDRKFWPTLAVPVVMVPNRIVLDAHTWFQTVGAFAITAAVVVSVYWWQTSDGRHADRASAAS